MILEKRIPLKYWFKEIKWDLLIVSVFSILIYFFKIYVINLDIPLGIGTFLGTAIALLLSFKLSQSYDRWWEARKIWGAIVNDSRSFVVQLKQFNKESENSMVKTMSYRQIAWCYALGSYLRKLDVPDNLEDYISQEEIFSLRHKKLIPLAAPGSVTERIIKINNITKSNVISIFVDFSIPFFTPAIIIKAVRPIKTKNHNKGRIEPPMKSLYMLFNSSGDFPSKPLVIAW